jgi:hypothetical protein
MIQTNFIRPNQRIGINPEINTKDKEIVPPNSPTGVVGSEPLFEERQQPQLVEEDYNNNDYEYQPTTNLACGCFNFLDFFNKEKQDDNFISIPIKNVNTGEQGGKFIDPTNSNYDIKEGVHDQGWYDNRGETNRFPQRIFGQNESRISSDEEELNVVNYHRDKPHDNTSLFNVTSDGVMFNDGYGDLGEMDDVDIQLSFSMTCFSENDDTEEYTNEGATELTNEHIQHVQYSDANSDDSSTLSFEASEFDEQEFEAGFDIEVDDDTFNESDPSLMSLNAIDAHKLPTIQENVENSFSCDVGNNFNHFFTCTR